MRASIVIVFVAACGGSQTPDGENTEAFCESYEVNYTASCRENCDAGLAQGDQKGARECEATCNADLSNDGEFRDRCAARAEQLGK